MSNWYDTLDTLDELKGATFLTLDDLEFNKSFDTVKGLEWFKSLDVLDNFDLYKADPPKERVSDFYKNYVRTVKKYNRTHGGHLGRQTIRPVPFKDFKTTHLYDVQRKYRKLTGTQTESRRQVEGTVKRSDVGRISRWFLLGAGSKYKRPVVRGKTVRDKLNTVGEAITGLPIAMQLALLGNLRVPTQLAVGAGAAFKGLVGKLRGGAKGGGPKLSKIRPQPQRGKGSKAQRRLEAQRAQKAQQKIEAKQPKPVKQPKTKQELQEQRYGDAGASKTKTKTTTTTKPTKPTKTQEQIHKQQQAGKKANERQAAELEARADKLEAGANPRRFTYYKTSERDLFGQATMSMKRTSTGKRRGVLKPGGQKILDRQARRIENKYRDLKAHLQTQLRISDRTAGGTQKIKNLWIRIRKTKRRIKQIEARYPTEASVLRAQAAKLRGGAARIKGAPLPKTGRAPKGKPRKPFTYTVRSPLKGGKSVRIPVEAAAKETAKLGGKWAATHALFQSPTAKKVQEKIMDPTGTDRSSLLRELKRKEKAGTLSKQEGKKLVYLTLGPDPAAASYVINKKGKVVRAATSTWKDLGGLFLGSKKRKPTHDAQGRKIYTSGQIGEMGLRPGRSVPKRKPVTKKITPSPITRVVDDPEQGTIISVPHRLLQQQGGGVYSTPSQMPGKVVFKDGKYTFAAAKPGPSIMAAGSRFSPGETTNLQMRFNPDTKKLTYLKGAKVEGTGAPSPLGGKTSAELKGGTKGSGRSYPHPSHPVKKPAKTPEVPSSGVLE